MVKPKTQRKRRRTVAEDGPRPVDVHVGSRVRLRRTLLGMSQQALAESVGVSFQQIQKYETGANRIGSSRLYEFSEILDVPVSFFFDDMPDEAKNDAAPPIKADVMIEEDIMRKPETLELLKAFYHIDDARTRKHLLEFVKAKALAS